MGNLFCIGRFEGWNCSLFWIVIILLFFITAIFRRQVAENLIGIDFSLIGGTISSVGVFILISLIFGSMKWGFIFGIIGAIIGGFLLVPFFPDASSEGGSWGFE
jgi:hypothetical protein